MEFFIGVENRKIPAFRVFFLLSVSKNWKLQRKHIFKPIFFEKWLKKSQKWQDDIEISHFWGLEMSLVNEPHSRVWGRIFEAVLGRR